MAPTMSFLAPTGPMIQKPTNHRLSLCTSNILTGLKTKTKMGSISVVSTNLHCIPVTMGPALTPQLASLTNLQCIPVTMGPALTPQLASLTNSARVLLNSPIAQVIYGLAVGAALSLYVIPWLLNRALSDRVDRSKLVVEAMLNPLQCLMVGCVLLNYCVQEEVELLSIEHKNQLFWTLVIGCSLWFTNKLTRDIMDQYVGALKKDEDGKKAYIDLVYADNFLHAALWSVVGVCCLKIWHIQGDKMFNSLGLGGVLITYISKDLFKNILIGMSIRFNNLFQVGDTIQGGNIEGKVLKMGLVSVTLLNKDEFVTYISYSALCTKELNKSHDKYSVVRIKFSMTLTDSDVISRIIRDIKEKLNAYDGIIAAKPPYCLITGLENTCVEVSIQAFFPKKYEDRILEIKHDILYDAIEIMRSHGAIVSTKRK